MKWSVKMWNGKFGDMRKILSASWSWQEFIEFLSAYSYTLYEKHEIKSSWADEMNGSRMNDIEWILNDKQAKSKFQVVSPVERR